MEVETGPPPGLVSSRGARAVREYTFEFKAAFWMVAAFTVVTFALWMALPGDHRALPVLERTWPPLLAGFAGLVFGKLA